MENPATNQTNLAEYAGIGAPTVNWHIKRLKAAGLVEAQREGRFVRYSATRVEEIVRLLRIYQPSVLDRWTERLTGILTEID